MAMYAAMAGMQIIFIVCVFLINGCHSNIKVRDCEPIKISLCESLGYNYTAMPNFVGHENQEDAEFQLQTFRPLINYGCSRHLQFFLCSAYVPMCTEKLHNTLGPCRPMCELVKTSCEPVLKNFGFSWPSALNCSKFPPRNDDTTMCMMPEGVAPKDGATPSSSQYDNILHPVSKSPDDFLDTNGALNHNACGGSQNGHEKYVFNNETDPPRCTLRCDKHELFGKQDKNFAEIFIAIFSIACLILTMFAVVTFLIDAERPSYPERLVILIAFCYMSCCIAYLVRIGIGRQAAICEVDRNTNIHILVTDGLQNPNCVIIFLLLYYFGSASHLWWIILALTWFLVAGLKWSHESVHRHSSCFHLAAWGIAAAKTILVLLLRYVDADELTGLCYVGNRNRNHLIAFVISPLMIYLFLGLSLFVAGLAGLFRNRRQEQNNCGKVEKMDSLLVKICIFSLVYVLSSGCVIGCYIYEFINMQKWLSSNESHSPNIEIFMLKIVSFLVPGFAAGLWAWSKNTVKSWKSFSRRLCSCHGNTNKTVNTRNTSYPQIQYHHPSHQSQNAGPSLDHSYNLNSSYNYYYGPRVMSLSAHNTSMDSSYKARGQFNGGDSII